MRRGDARRRRRNGGVRDCVHFFPRLSAPSLARVFAALEKRLFFEGRRKEKKGVVVVAFGFFALENIFIGTPKLYRRGGTWQAPSFKNTG